MFFVNKIDFPAPNKEIKKLFQMRILKLLNKKYLSIIIILLFFWPFFTAEDKPVDIWNIDEKKIEIYLMIKYK